MTTCGLVYATVERLGNSVSKFDQYPCHLTSQFNWQKCSQKLPGATPKNKLHPGGWAWANLLLSIADGGWWTPWTWTRISRWFDWGVKRDRRQMIKLKWTCQGKNSVFKKTLHKNSPPSQSIKNCQNRILLKMQGIFKERMTFAYNMCWRLTKNWKCLTRRSSLCDIKCQDLGKKKKNKST